MPPRSTARRGGATQPVRHANERARSERRKSARARSDARPAGAYAARDAGQCTAEEAVAADADRDGRARSAAAPERSTARRTTDNGDEPDDQPYDQPDERDDKPDDDELDDQRGHEAPAHDARSSERARHAAELVPADPPSDRPGLAERVRLDAGDARAPDRAAAPPRPGRLDPRSGG